MPTETSHPAILGSSRPRDASLAAAVSVGGLLVSIGFALQSPEGIVQFDDLTHYLYAKWAWRWPAYLLDGWGRPGFTALYFLPAALGWTACRVLSAVLTAASAWLAFRIAQRLDLRHAWAAALLCYAQPLFFQLSLTTLTETALAFYLVLAVYLAQRDRWAWSSAVISLGFVTRHEAIIFLPIWVYFARATALEQGGSSAAAPPAALADRPLLVTCHGGQARFNCSWDLLRRLWPIIWAPLVVNLLCWMAGMSRSISLLFQLRPESQYGRGGWLTYFCRAMEAWGPGLTVLAMVGVVFLWKRPRGGALIAACAVVFFAAQTIVRALGLFESGGYARFLVPISPLVAIAALVGWQHLLAADVRRRRFAALLAAAAMIILWIAMIQQLALHRARLDEAAELPDLNQARIAIKVATVIVVVLAGVSVVRARPDRSRWFSRVALPGALLGMMLLASYALCHPLYRSREAAIVDHLCRWLAENELARRPIITAHVWVDYATGQELPPGRPSVRRRLELAPTGALFVWDQQFAEQGHGLPRDEFENHPAFRMIHETQPTAYRHEPYLVVYEKAGLWNGGA